MLLSLPVLLLSACGGLTMLADTQDTGSAPTPDTAETDDTEDPAFAFQDRGITIVLSGAPLGFWDIDVLLYGLATTVRMDTHQVENGAWDEQFFLIERASGPSGSWDEWTRHLRDSNNRTDYEANGATTINDPTEAHYAVMTFMFTAEDATGASICVVSGADVSYYLDQGSDCEDAVIDVQVP